MKISQPGLEQLPPWFERPRPEPTQQCTLFPEALPAVLAGLRVSSDELARWYKCGWVSFGPDCAFDLEPRHVNEIRFVRDVVRSGLSDAHIVRLLAELPRPMTFDPNSVAYSFALGWVMARPAPEPDDPSEIVDEHVEAWLEELAAAEDARRLTELRDRIDGLLASIVKLGDDDNK